MFGGAFDWIMALICAVCAALLLSGHGDGLMKMFGTTSSRPSMTVERKKTREEELRYQRVIGVYCLILTVCEVVLALFGSTHRAVPIITIIVAIAGLVGIVQYMKRNSR